MACRADGLGTGLGPMTDEDYRKMESSSSSNTYSYKNNITINKYKLQELEEDLCTVRDLLFKLIEDRELPDNIETILNDQMIMHKSHRKEDFEFLKKEINNRYDSTNNFIKTIEKYYKRNYDTEQEFYDNYDSKYKALEKYTKDREIINSMNFDDFWKDKYLFEDYKKKM
jgi:hypothetical protein